MKKNYYNIDDEQFKNVIESLKELPRVDAPPDFEMNLKRRLNSIKYQEKEENKGFFYYFSLKRPLIPAASAAALAIVAFLFISRQPEVENPFMKLPPQRTQTQNDAKNNESAKGSGKNHLIDPGSISSDDVVIKKEAPKNNSRTPAQRESLIPQREITDPIASSEKPAARRLRDLDFGGFGSDLDKNLRAKPNPNGSDRYGEWGQGSSNVNFGGFNLAPGSDPEMDMLRARMDSLRRLWLKGNR